MLRGGPVVQIGVILVSVLGLRIGARPLVDAAVRSARRFGLSELTIGLTVVAIGASTLELSVTVDAAYERLGDIAVTNVLGSNIYNVAFVLGAISLFRVIPVAESLVSRDSVAPLASTLLGGLVLFDLRVTRLRGAPLVAAFVAYTAYLLRGAQTEANGATEQSTGQSADQSLGDDGMTRPIADRIDFPGQDTMFLAGGLALVLVSGDYMVLATSELARGADVSQWVIGGTIVAAGTSAPEFVVSLVTLRQRSLGVSVDSVVGSNIFNITDIVGVVTVTRPLVVSASAFGTFAWFVTVTLLIVTALWTRRVLSRVGGASFATSEVMRWILGFV